MIERSEIPWSNVLEKFADISANTMIHNIDLLTKQLEEQKKGDILQQDDSINAYEILEKKTDASDFCSNSESIVKFIKAGDGNFCSTNESSIISNEPIEKDELPKTTQLYPRPQDIFDTSSDESICSDQKNRDIHVRFSDKVVVVNQIEDDTTDLETNMTKLDLSKTSTPKNKLSDIYKSTVEASAGAESTLQQTQMEEIREKTEMMKERLKELEGEIESYKKYNAELIRLKQQHELDKLKLLQEREEMQEKLHDERIKMEVYFHDERMKIEEERQKALKEAQKPNKKDRQEIEKLKDQIIGLQSDMKTKEAKRKYTASTQFSV